MKFEYEVKVETGVLLTLHPDFKSVEVQQAFMDDFSSSIFSVDTFDELLRHVASQVAIHGCGFVEGFGHVRESWDCDFTNPISDFQNVAYAEYEILECDVVKVLNV